MSKEPRTAHDWLALPEDKLGRALGEALTPRKHDWNEDVMVVPGLCNLRFRCNRCFMRIADSVKAQHIYDCTPDPIVIDWNVAMAWRDKVIVVDGYFYGHIAKVSDAEDHHLDTGYWIATYAQPKHYLIAAARAAEGAKE